MYLSLRPIKGQSFRLYFSGNGTRQSSIGTGNASAMPDFIAFSSLTFLLSKDGGSFVSPSNAPVDVSGGRGYVDLTTSEMNADVICFSFYKGTYTGNPATTTAANMIVIYTTISELSAAPTLNSSISDKITAIFQYLFFKRTVTSSQEKLYKSDGTTVLATGELSDDGTIFSKGEPS